MTSNPSGPSTTRFSPTRPRPGGDSAARPRLAGVVDAAARLAATVADTARVPVADVVIAICHQWAARHTPSSPGPVAVAAVAHWADAPWTETDPSELAKLPAVVASWTADGVDAERLLLAAAHLEALNHLGLLWHQANKLCRTFPGRTAEDLVGFGWPGLVNALRRYDPDTALFATFAVPKIAGAIRDGVRSEDVLPKRLTTFRNQVAEIEDDLTRSLGRGPTLAELSAAVPAPGGHVALIPRLSPAASLDELADATADTPHVWADVTADPSEDALRTVVRDAIHDALGTLDPDDAAAVRLLVLEDVGLVEARAQTGATTRQLRARQKRGLEQLSGLLADWAPATA